MNVKVNELMVEKVMTATPHQTVGHVRQLMNEKRVSCLPVVGPEGEPVGVVTATDLLDGHAEGTPISQFMAEKLYTVPQYSDVSLAARVMRNHRIHHVLVTHEQKLVGLISSFDLLKLVENHRFVMKNAPDTPKKKGGKRQQDESAADG